MYAEHLTQILIFDLVRALISGESAERPVKIASHFSDHMTPDDCLILYRAMIALML